MTYFLRRSLLLVFLGGLLIAHSAFARTWFIAADGSGVAPTIQGGIDLASPGDTVLVGPGRYADILLQITKDIALVSRDGASATTLSGSTMVIFAKNLGADALIRGFEVSLPDLGGWGCVGPIALAGRSSTTPSLSAGIRTENSACSITENFIHGGYHGIEVDGSAPVIMDNDISHSGVGIDLTSSDAVVSANHVTDCAACISSYDGTPLIMGNTVGGNLARPCDGISVAGSSSLKPHIVGNTIENIDLDAIYVSGSAIIENNRIRDGYRVYLYYAQGCELRGNVLIETALDTQVANATIEQNTIVDASVFLGLGSFTRNLAYRSEIHCTLGIVLSCNDSWGAAINYSGACAGAPGQNGNISVDPQFCGISGSGNYQLQSDSPCAPGNHPDGADCGTIGALDVGCGALKVEATSWGAIKAMYRR